MVSVRGETKGTSFNSSIAEATVTLFREELRYPLGLSRYAVAGDHFFCTGGSTEGLSFQGIAESSRRAVMIGFLRALPESADGVLTLSTLCCSEACPVSAVRVAPMESSTSFEGLSA
jgi:hypothetical protein